MDQKMIKSGRYYDIKRSEEVLVTKDKSGTYTLAYTDSGVMRNIKEDYIRANLISHEDLTEATNILFDQD